MAGKRQPAKRQPAVVAEPSPKKAKVQGKLDVKAADKYFKMCDPEGMKVNAQLYADLQQAMTTIMDTEAVSDIFTATAYTKQNQTQNILKQLKK